MDILLVMPYMEEDESKYLSSRDSAFPIGLGYVAAVLERAGHVVDIFDFQIQSNDLAAFVSKIKSRPWHIVGFSVTTATRQAAVHLARLCKQNLPDCFIIAGGAYPTVYPKALLSLSMDIDVEVIGEGEITVVELAEFLASNGELSAVKGIAYRAADNRLIQTEERPLIEDLDAVPFPAHHLFQLDFYSPPPGMFFRLPLRHIITSRGCPFNCIYCDDRKIWRGRCRMRSAENIVEEMALLQKKFGAKEIHFYDDTFTVNKKRIARLCQLLRENELGLIWRCASRVDTVTQEMLFDMYTAGCRSISYGIESGDNGILKRMGKGTTVSQARDAVRWTNNAKIQAKGFFMLNFPGDTIETTEKTIALAKELKLDFVGFNLTVPHHGERLSRLVEENYTINEKVYYSDTPKLGNEIYFFQPGLPEEYLRDVYSRVVREFYFRPVYMLRMLGKIRNFAMLKSYVVGFFRLFKIRVCR